VTRVEGWEMIQSGLEKFGAHQKARQLFNLVVAGLRVTRAIAVLFPSTPDTRPSVPDPPKELRRQNQVMPDTEPLAILNNL
jgi:hypothetical protein